MSSLIFLPVLAIAVLSLLPLLYRWRPKFTFSTFTPDPNLQTPHSHKTQIYTSPNLHRSDLHKTKFTQPNIDIPKFTRLKFTQKLNPNSHRPKFTQTQIYTHIFGHRLQDFKKPKFTQPKFTQNPNLHHPKLHNSDLHKTQRYTTRIYTKLIYSHIVVF